MEHSCAKAGVGMFLFGLVVGVLLCGAARADVVILIQQELESSYEWRPVATGDFNGDGVTDVLWENESTGQTVVWCFGPSHGSGGPGGSIIIGGGQCSDDQCGQPDQAGN